jgi:hypothetical protein
VTAREVASSAFGDQILKPGYWNCLHGISTACLGYASFWARRSSMMSMTGDERPAGVRAGDFFGEEALRGTYH